MEYDIRLIALDLDGTLYNDKKEITPHTLAVLEAAARQGVIILPATGRTATGFPNVLEKLPFVRYGLTSNGAAVHDFQENRPVYTDLLPLDKLLILLDYAESLNVMADVYVDGYGYSRQDLLEHAEQYVPAQPMVDYMRATRRAVPDMRKFVTENGRDVEKVVFFFGDLALRDRVWDEMRVDPRWESMFVTTALRYNIEISNRTATKGNTLLRFGAQMGLRKEQLMACGDGLNDQNMIEAAGLGVAMGNADPALKAVADFITKTNQEDGVAWAIEQFVLRKNG